MGRLKTRTFEILEIPSKPGDVPGRTFDLFIISLIVLNIAAVMFETVGDNAERYEDAVFAFEVFSLAVFGVEFLLRVWSITANPAYAHPIMGRLRFLVSPIAIIDLVAILPAFLAWFFPVTDLRFVRVVRLLRLLKLGRYSQGVLALTRALRSRRHALLTSLFVVIVALLITSSLMYYAEHDAQQARPPGEPRDFDSIPDSMWWGIVALTTTGYGDVVPMTPMGKVLGGVTALIGIGVIALPVGILASGFLDEINVAKRETTTCPHCGKPLGSHPAAPPPKKDAAPGDVRGP